MLEPHPTDGSNPQGEGKHRPKPSLCSDHAAETANAAVEGATAEQETIPPLTAEQKELSDDLVLFAKHDPSGLKNFGLQAGAGCGKNFTSAHPDGFIAQLIKAGRNVGIAAPTHVACGVSREYLAKSGIDIEPMTLHSILGMKPIKNGGEKKFAPTGKGCLSDFDVLLIDEASMVSPQLYQEALDQKQPYQVFIWMGDPYQLPPVTEGRSKHQLSPAIELPPKSIFELTETHRFGGPLLEKATRLRTDSNEWKARWTAAGDSIRTVEHEYDLREAFKKHLKANDHSVRMLAYTNKRVDLWNRIAHTRIYGCGADPYLPGMKLLTREPIQPTADRLNDKKPHRGMLWGTSFEVDIVSVSRASVTLEEQPKYWAPFETWLISAYSPITKDLHSIQVLDEAEESRFQGYLNSIGDAAKRSTAKKRKALWDIFWLWKDSFADVQPAWCSTVHRAQGQGIDHVFLDLLDLKNPGKYSPEMAKSLLYTAATRARKSITVIGA